MVNNVYDERVATFSCWCLRSSSAILFDWIVALRENPAKFASEIADSSSTVDWYSGALE